MDLLPVDIVGWGGIIWGTQLLPWRVPPSASLLPNLGVLLEAVSKKGKELTTDPIMCQ